MSRMALLRMHGIVRTNGCYGKILVFWTFFVFGPVWIPAQEPATSFDQLKLLLARGDKVTLTDLSGNTIKSRIERIAKDEVDVKVRDQVRTFAEKDIRQITQKKHDSVLNGILVGAGVGFGATLPINLGIADESEKGLAVAASAFWGLIGGSIGALVDVSVTQKQLIYFRPRNNVSWSIQPFYSNSQSRFQRRGAGALMPNTQPSVGNDPAKGLAVTVRF